MTKTHDQPSRSGSQPADPVEVVGGTAEDAEALRRISARWIDTYLAGDIDGFMALVADDIVVMAEDQPTQVGKAAARAFFSQRVGRPGVRFIDDLKEIRVEGQWAYFRGDFVFEMAAGNGQPARRHSGRYFVLYEKGQDGQWRMIRDMDNGRPEHG